MRQILALFIVSSILLPEASFAAPAVIVSAPTAILIDSNTHKILYAKTPHLKRPPASTAKVLTAILAMEHLGLNQTINIPSFVNSLEPTKVYLRRGERYRVSDLIQATLISSANDAAEVLAWKVAGSRTQFAEMMNQKARQIGAKRSHFVKASGLPARRQYSTAYDMALIMQYAQRYPFLVKTMRTKRMTIRSLSGRRILLKNHNKMLWKDPREVVGKTGWTREARHCFVGHMRVFGQKTFVAMLGSHRLWRDLKTLLDYQFGKVISPLKQNRKIWGVHETKQIQRALRRAGFEPGSIDGRFGPKTIRAVQQFQAAQRLKPDGVVGSKTWRKLKRYL